MEPSEVGTVVLAAVLELVVASALALLLRMRLSAYTAALRSCLSLELAHIGLTTVWLFVQAEADRAAGASAAADATLAEATAAGQNVTEATRAAQAAAQMALSTLYASNSVRVSAGVCDGLAILLFAFAELEYWQQIAPFAPGITVKGVRWGKTLLYFSAPLYVATAFKPVMKQPIRQWMFTFELCVTCFFCVFDVAQSLHLLHVVFRRIRNVSFVFQVRFAFLAGFALIILIIGAGLHGYNDNVHPQYLVFSDLTIPVYIMCFIGTMQMVRAALGHVLPVAVGSAIGAPDMLAAGRPRDGRHQSNRGLRRLDHSVSHVAQVIFEGAEPVDPASRAEFDGQTASGLSTLVQKMENYTLNRSSVLGGQSIRMSVFAGQSNPNSFITPPPAALLATDTVYE